MFDSLTDRFTRLTRKLRGYGRLSQKEIADSLREIRELLLEADVNYKVVGHFIRSLDARLKEKNITNALKPGELINFTLYEELTKLLGEKTAKLDLSGSPAIISLVGLQGTGKTTFAGKLAAKLKSRSPMLVACDPKRPAASEQLGLVAKQAGCAFFPASPDVIATCRAALKEAKTTGNNLLVLDTAGRLHVDDEMMQELVAVQDAMSPSATILVLDGMVGQDAVNQAQEFAGKLKLTGCAITKLDGDTRGGAIVSVRHATGLPILYIGTGEKLQDVEEFHPDRIASRILGFGDMRSLAEKVQAATTPEQQQETAKKFLKGKFDFEDFLAQLRSIKKMGNLSKLMAMIPGAQGLDVDEGEMVAVEAMIQSMTPEERHDPDIINGSRRRRIAEGSGHNVADVNRLLKEFEQSRAMARQLSSGKMPRMRGLR